MTVEGNHPPQSRIALATDLDTGETELVCEKCFKESDILIEAPAKDHKSGKCERCGQPFGH